jgi:hypothetical protein
MHEPTGLSPPPAAEPACPVPDPASRAPITTSIDSLTNRLRERYQFNLQAIPAAIQTDLVPTKSGCLVFKMPLAGAVGRETGLEPAASTLGR